MSNPVDKEQLKRALLQQRLKQRLGERSAQQTLRTTPRADRAQPLPLSWGQQRLWFLDQFDPTAAAAYNMPAALRLRGTLDRDALRRTLDRIVYRHENLRTHFGSRDGTPFQIIAPADSGFALRERDLRDAAATLPERELLALAAMEAESAAPFDLAAGPLIRGLLLGIADDEHVLLINKHHIISDGWSIGVLVREICALYEAFHRGAPDPLPALDIHYADFAAWQRHYLQGDTLQRQVNFWAKHLAGAPALLELPTDRPRPAQQSHAGDVVEFALGEALSTQLRALSQRHGVTLFMTLLAGWSVLLSRLSGQEDLVVGTPFANRQSSELEALTGFFVNTLAVRVRTDHSLTVSQLLAQIKATTLDAYAHQDLPFEQVFEVLQPVRSMSHSPIFQVMLALNNTPASRLTVPGLTLEQVRLPRTASYFDMSLFLNDNGGAIGGIFDFSTALFERATIERYAHHLVRVLEAMVENDRQTLRDIPLLSAEEREEVLFRFNASDVAFPQGELLHGLIERQAALRPDAVAVEFGDTTLTYAELDRRANRLAHRLVALGVKPDDRVALCLERSEAMIVSLLAVLKSGGAYVPLDPAYPPDRLNYMLTDCAPTALITQSSLRDRVLGEHLPTIVLDDADTVSALDMLPASAPDVPSLSAEKLAYVIYTSGSTGLPKGTMLEHRNVVNLVHGHAAMCGTSAQDRVLQFASFSFDNSVVEVFPALAYGATIVMRPSDMLVPDANFAQFLREKRITITDLPTAFWHQWAQEVQAGRCLPPPSLRLVLAGGEKAELRHLRQWFEGNEARPIRWINTYGPTEATVNAAVLSYEADAELPPRDIPIGRPVANGRLYVLDAYGQPTPIGIPGEIHIGGAGVARGYHHREELTRGRFIADPFSANGRLYRTGDLGRWLADGTLEYIGRNDFQVKIRGFRIELGEIETKLCACADVREAVVLAREDQPGDKRLVAYVIAHADRALSIAALRNQLATLLPEHMLPNAFVQIDAFPVNTNGKIDRKALPAPDSTSVIARAYEAPRGQTEIALAEIWQALLGLERVGRQDHFFELGGHSLLVVSLIERLRQAGLHADVRSVFTTPVLAGLAAHIAHSDAQALFVAPPNRIAADCAAITPDLLPLIALSQSEIDALVASVPGGVTNIQDIYPLAPLQEGILFHHLMQQEGDVYLLRSIGAFERRDLLDACLGALQVVIDRHDILRSAVRWEELPQPVQIVHRHAVLPVEEFAPHVATEVLRQLTDYTDPRRTRLDLTRAPLLSVIIAQEPKSGEWLMALLQHHIVTDHVTLELALAEVRDILQGRADLLPAPVPYRNFIAQARAVPVAEHEQFFRAKLADFSEPSAPFGVLDVHTQAEGIVELRLPLAADLCRGLRATARQQGVSAAILFHVAWARVVEACSGRDDVVFGTTLSGRLQGSEGANRVLGMFINTLPIRLSLASLSAEEAVRYTFRAMSELIAHEQGSLALAQRCSGVNAALPLFTTLLNYHHTALGTSMPDEATPVTIWEGMRMLRVEERTNYPITVSVDDLGDDFALITQCVAGIDAGRVSAYFATALASLVEALNTAPQTPVLELPILPSSERTALLGPDALASAPTSLIHALFEAQAAMRPNATALTFEATSISYGELNRRANQLAHRLIAVGVEPDQRVAICLDRGVDLVVGVMAVLKAGGAYVPMDPAYPPDRLTYMLADSAPVAIITQQSLRDRVVSEVPTLVLDDASTAIELAGLISDNPNVSVSPPHLAYVIYTSGSTGQPKGVMVEHRHVTRLFSATQDEFYFDDTDVWTLFHSFAFDFSVWEIFGALLHGGRLVIVPALCARSPAEFYALLCRERVTVLNQTPSAFRSLIAAQADSTSAHSLRCIVFGGEALDLHTLKPWIVRNDPQRTQLINMYGITEVTVHATYRALSAADIEAGLGSVIGRPLSDLRLLILDANRQPSPIGVSGEIYIGGAGVARGYLNRDALTSERFIADPFHPGERLYKTGDLGRWRDNGDVEYLGRNDFQVKIRGFRIELGEIEARLVACAGVHEGVVIAREDQPGDKRLIAYLIADGELSIAALRGELSALLPEHMVPSAFVQIDAFPLTPNGKLDRKALPAPDQAAVLTRAYEPPQGDVESTLATAWQALLGLDRVGRHDHFFELGGHSLLVVSLIERLRQVGLSTNVRTIFAHPVLSSLAQQVAVGDNAVVYAVPPNRISADGTAITPDLLPLIDLTQGEIDTIVAATPGGVANLQDLYPLAPLQEGILFHHLLETEGDAYLLRSVVAFDTHQRLDTFLSALQHVIDRHDILRSAVRWQGLSQPVQIVHRQAPLPVHTVVAESDAQAELLAQTDPRRTRLDLTRAPLLSATIMHDRTTGEWLMALLSHHLIDDNYTMQLVMAEVQAVIEGQLDTLPPSMPYRNFIAQVRSVPDSEHEAYFRGQLADIDVPTAPFDVFDTQGDGENIVEHHAMVPDALVDRLRATAKQHGTTPAVLFHAAWAKVLSVLCGRDDVVFGTTLSGRLQGSAGADRVLGMFINTLPIRMSLEDATVGEVVDQTYQRLSELLGHEQAPLALAQRCSGVAAPLPLFTSLLNYRHTQLVAAPEWQGMRLLHGQERTNYPLTLSIDDRGHDFGITAQCAAQIDPQRVTGYLITALEGLVDGLATERARSIRDVTILSAEERLQVVESFNVTSVEYPRDRLLHRLFEDQAAAQPDAIAVVVGELSLTYGALNRRANQLAHRLIDLGIAPDSRVAICADRSLEMVIGLLAILKAGGAYVPLDPAYPADRLAYMLADSAPVVLLTQSDLRGQLTTTATCTTLWLDDAATFTSQPDTNPHIASLTARNLAYVIYTSGSTGQPKGAMNQHDGVVNRLLWARDEYAVTTQDRVLQKTPFSFDVSVWEFFLPLISGARLVMARPGGHQDPQYLVDEIDRSGITMLHFVPSMLQVFLDQASTARCASLRRVLCSGEALAYALKERFDRAFPRMELHNLYGPTEAAVDVTYWRCASSRHAGIVPIGFPIANTHIYVLDARRQPVPIGIVGEIHIGGIGVGRGYLNRDALTAERFVVDPFREGGRLYKTGDLGRWLFDGSVEYLGRNDFQVKIRGFRIELGEIEARLGECVGVRDAVVVARDAGDDDPHLVAYWLGAACSDGELRAQLTQSLPEHMLPSAFVRLDAFPLTPNGKLDRAALPAPDAPALGRERVSPRNATEVSVAEIFSDLLGIAPIGIHDSFFDLGGHSLKAASATFRINSRLGGSAVSLADFYRQPTIEAVAKLVDGGAQRHELVQVLRKTASPALTVVCCPYAGAPVSVFQAFADALSRHGDIDVMAIAIPGNEFGTTAGSDQNVETLAAACVERMAAVEGRIAVYGHCVGSYLALEITHRLEQAGRDVAFLATGGAFLATRMERLLMPHDSWKSKSDADIQSLIASWGGASEWDDPAMLRFMIANFRRDSQMAQRYERTRKKMALAAPVITVIGTADPLTPNYAKNYLRWNQVAETVHLRVLDRAHHYFIGDRAEEVAELLAPACRGLRSGHPA